MTEQMHAMRMAFERWIVRLQWLLLTPAERREIEDRIDGLLGEEALREAEIEGTIPWEQNRDAFLRGE